MLTLRPTRSLLVLSILLAVVAPARRSGAQGPVLPPARTEVPVRTVVLYSSGVGYFEHAGTVRGTGATDIRFKTDQINDVLKSLVLQDRDGGRVTAITYPSRDPVSKTLKSFQVDITGNPGLAELLNQVRGARVTANVGAEAVRGTILGVETRRKPMEKGEAAVVPVLNVLTGATIRAVDLQSVRSISLDDPRLEDELARALAALSLARDQDKKPVSINFTGAGDRRLRIGYVVETPVWKTSYRLLLEGGSARLQGWAIVENQTESDWNDVALSLVSGRPISFSMDLYQPLYAARAKVTPEQFAALRPQVYGAGVAPLYGTNAANGGLGPVEITAKAEAMERARVGFAVGRMNLLSDVVVTGTDARDAQWFDDPTVAAVAQASKLGELFQYSVPNVTLARQKSAMLPIVTDTVGMERVSIYNAAVLQSNPLYGLRLKNVTGKHLLQGPITILDGDRYAGDARIDDIPPGQDRLLSFGVDLDMVVNNERQTFGGSVLTARIVKGILIVDRRLAESRDYVVDNKGDKDRTIVIEHPVRTGWTLYDTQKPVETTVSVHRFQGAAPARRATLFTVREQYVRKENIRIAVADTSLLLPHIATAEIPAAVRDALNRAIQFKRALADTERQIADRAKQEGDITQEQARIRDNMKTVNAGTPYYKRLLEKLNEQESAIERLQRERDDLTKRRDAQKKELDDFVNALVVG